MLAGRPEKIDDFEELLALRRRRAPADGPRWPCLSCDPPPPCAAPPDRTPQGLARGREQTDMAKLYYESDADPSLIAGRKVAIIGYGSQGHAHALNLLESGVDVRVGLREGSSQPAQGGGGRAAGDLRWPRRRPRPTSSWCCCPTPSRRRCTRRTSRRTSPRATPCSSPTASTSASARSCRRPASTWPWWRPRAPATWCAAPTPRAAASRRSSPWHQDASGKAHDLALSYAHAIGATRAGVLDTTFDEETETDLFGEQVVLCGGLTALVPAGFETLVEAGYQPESAYFECLHELKLIVDLMYEQGIAGMRYSISDTAEYGDLTRGPGSSTTAVRAEMQQILDEIRERRVRRGVDRREQGRPAQLRGPAPAGQAHPIEKVGRAAGHDAVHHRRQAARPGRLGGLGSPAGTTT